MSRRGSFSRGTSRPEGLGFPVAIASLRGGPGRSMGHGASRLARIHGAMFAGLVVLGVAGTSLGGSLATMLACALILLCGLPHGALDIELIKHEQAPGRLGMSAVLATYLGFAAAMTLLWHAAPTAALAVFLVVAVVHFAEDWPELQSNFLAQGMAIALLSAPTLLHLAELKYLFEAVSGRAGSALLADLMLLLAPMSLAVAIVGIATLWLRGVREPAAISAMTLAGMVLLPPVVGFALFFCLAHSPRHLKSAFERMAPAPSAARAAAAVTLAALGITAALFAGQARVDLSAQIIPASFMTLSVLTVPHMIVPVMVAALASRRGAVLPRNQSTWR